MYTNRGNLPPSSAFLGFLEDAAEKPAIGSYIPLSDDHPVESGMLNVMLFFP